MNELSNAFSLLEVDVADEENLKGIAVTNNGVNSEGKKGFFGLINNKLSTFSSSYSF